MSVYNGCMECLDMTDDSLQILLNDTKLEYTYIYYKLVF